MKICFENFKVCVKMMMKDHCYFFCLVNKSSTKTKGEKKCSLMFVFRV